MSCAKYFHLFVYLKGLSHSSLEYFTDTMATSIMVDRKMHAHWQTFPHMVVDWEIKSAITFCLYFAQSCHDIPKEAYPNPSSTL